MILRLCITFIVCLQVSFAQASEWSMVVYKTSVKSDCPEICGLEIFKNGVLVVSDLMISVRDPEQVSVQEKFMIEAALKNEGIRTSFEDILRSARVIDNAD